MTQLKQFAMLLLLFLGFAYNPLSAQEDKKDGRENGYWLLGLNTGAAWQNNDMRIRPGAGWGFYIGPNLYYSRRSPFSLDLVFRYLYTGSAGQDYRPLTLDANSINNTDGTQLLAGANTYGNTSFFNEGLNSTYNYTSAGGGTNRAYMNHLTHFHDFALELRLNFENLRRRSNILFNVYGGLGIGVYKTKFDQLGSSGSLYQYETIDDNLARNSKVSELAALRDGEFETNATDGFQATLTPTLGFELGYWFTPHFALAIGHRATWTLQDDFDGYISTNRKRNDLHHYANLAGRWDLYATSSRVETKPNVNPVAPPDVVIINPQNCPIISNDRIYTFRISIKNIDNPANISFVFNRQQVTNFRYDMASGILEATVSLQEGNNTLDVSATNSAGRDVVACSVTYTPPRVDPNPQPTVQPPTVNITNPNNGASLNTNTVSVFATITNVASANNVTFTVNGQPSRNFTLNGTSFVANGVALQQGNNSIQISANNTGGNASDAVGVTYVIPQPTVQPPTVRITNPNNGASFNTNTVSVFATITNVASANNVTFTVNGQPSRNFTLNETSFVANGVSLQQGNNNIQISANNTGGNASDAVGVTYVIPQPTVQPPTVRITNPNNGASFNTNTVSVFATITNVASANNVTFTVNGQPSRNFTLNGTSFVANGVSLQQGNNNIQISANNTGGNASDAVGVTYVIPQPTVQPPTVRITNPNNGASFNTNTVSVFATITNVASANNVTFTVNGQPSRNFTLNGTSFVANGVSLQQGNNSIQISANNTGGNASDAVGVTYVIPQPTVQPPTVRITNPNNGASFNTNTVSVFATITNVASANNVTFTVNGQPSRNFTLNGTSFVANSVSLQQGNNNIQISANNTGGNASDAVGVTYVIPQPTVQPPTVRITNPNNGASFNTNTVSVFATITNVASANNVTFTVNGQPSRNFTLNGTSFVANGVALQQGNNNIQISANNTGGNASDAVSVTYVIPQPTVQPPTVNITNPNQNPFNTNQNTATINATITNVTNANQVTFNVNGRNLTNFTLNGTNFTANGIGLQNGNNTITITATNAGGNASDNATIIYTAPQPLPTVDITSPNNGASFNTNSTSVAATITNVASANNVTFTVNGQPSRNFTLNGTTFVANGVTLQQGNNTIQITATNNAGNASDNVAVTYVIPQPTVQPPTVNITAPANNSGTATPNTNVTATITNISSASQITFTVNGQPVRNFNFGGTSFTANNVGLQQGTNNIVITATNAGGTASDNVNVEFKLPPPTVNITNPAQSPSNTNQNTATINATIQNVAAANQITCKVNGRITSNFGYQNGNFTLSNVQLQQGNNTVEISATNAVGNASDNTTIIYTAPVQAPTVNITNPSRNVLSTDQNTATIAATITNVNSPNEVTFTVNGQTNTNFTLNGNNFVANGVNLQNGNNAIVISATNAGGTASDNATITYTPLAEPTVNITSPSANPSTVSNNTVSIVATINNVTDASNVTFTVNGQPSRNFTFRGNSFTANNVVLQDGNNDISVAGTNRIGTATDRTVIVYNAPAPSAPQPVINTAEYNMMKGGAYQIVSEMTGVNSVNEITMTHNGQSVSGFSYDAGVLTFSPIPVVDGMNTYVITVRNAGGTATRTVTLNNTSGDDGGNNGGGNQNRPSNGGGNGTINNNSQKPDNSKTQPNNNGNSNKPNNNNTTKPENNTTKPNNTNPQPDNKGGKMNKPEPKPDDKGGKITNPQTNPTDNKTNPQPNKGGKMGGGK